MAISDARRLNNRKAKRRDIARRKANPVDRMCRCGTVHRDPYRSACRECTAVAARKRYHAATVEIVARRREKQREANREIVRSGRKREYNQRVPLERRMVHAARVRAKRLGVPCDLQPGDIVIPDVCPVLGIRLERGRGGWADGSPSLDRITPRAGYVKSNVRVISWRANKLKSNATARELYAIARWMFVEEHG